MNGTTKAIVSSRNIQEYLKNIAKINLNEVIISSSEGATPFDIMAVLAKLEVVKNLPPLPNVVVEGITNELISLKYTKSRLIDSYFKIISEKTYNNITIDMFIDPNDMALLRATNAAVGMINNSLKRYREGLTDDEIKYMRIQELEKAREEWELDRKKFLLEFREEFMGVIFIDADKFAEMVDGLKPKMDDYLRKRKAKTGFNKDVKKS